MLNRISYPRRGTALIVYVLALATLGTAIVAAVSLRTAVLVGAALALLFVSDLLTLRKAQPDVPVPAEVISRNELEAFADRLRDALHEVDSLPDDYVTVELSFECTDEDRAAEIVADLNAGNPTPLQGQGYAVDRALWRGTVLNWEGRA